MQDEEFGIRDAIDLDILMHREIHFGGSFDVMLDYYHKKGKGIQEEFSLKRIEDLAVLEKSLEKNLAPLLLGGAEAETIAKAKKTYQDLRDLYENKTKENRYPILIADLILTENENAAEEILSIVAEKEKIVPELLSLVRSEEFYNPLFPGFGQAPILAAQCLGAIGDKRAIIALFESIGKEEGNFFEETTSIQALKSIGEPARDFLIKVVQGKPYNSDNERAAIVLGEFPEEAVISQACFKVLQDPEAQKDPVLGTYLILACKGLKGTKEQKAFETFAKDPKTPSMWFHDIKTVLNEWQS